MFKENKKKKSLRNFLGIPITQSLYSSSEFNDGINSDGDISEMVQVVKEIENSIKKNKKNYEVYDIEESGIPLYTAQFEPDMSDKEVNETKKYKVHIKNPKTDKIVVVEFNQPIKKQTKNKPKVSSGKFWEGKQLKGLLEEIINPDAVDITTLKFNDNLSPLIWDDQVIKDDVRDALLKIGIEFIKSCKLEEYKYKDIVFVGSMANYTYTPQSDIDIHIIMDFTQFKINDELIDEYFKAKKELWSLNHDLKIKGHDVECYIQNSNEPYTSIGVFSLLKNDWIREPIKKMVSIDEKGIKIKASEFMNSIDKLEEKHEKGEDIVEDLTKVKDKIKKMRKNGLYKEGEYSTENFVFKVLRNSGYLEKVINLKNNNIDQNLSI